MARGTLPRFASTFFKTASSFYLAYKYGFFVAQVDGPSMFPTFIGKRELVLSECLPYVADRVKAGAFRGRKIGYAGACLQMRHPCSHMQPLLFNE